MVEHVDAVVIGAGLGGLAAAVTLAGGGMKTARNPRGAIVGYENTPANSGLGWLRNETSIANLFLVGAWTNSGGMNPAVTSGVEAAQQILARSRTLA